MSKPYTQFRLWTETLKKLRYIYAATGESMIAIVDRLVAQEFQKLQDEEQNAKLHNRNRTEDNA